MQLKIKIEGISELQQELGDIVTNQKIDSTLQRSALLVQGEAMRYCPVATGRLQKSLITRKINSLTWEIEATASYADYIEFGTYKMIAGTPEQPYVYASVKTGKYPSYRPFLRSALWDCQDRIIDLFNEAFKK